MKDTKKKHRILDRAGIIHIKGHIYATDRNAVLRYIKKAEADVRRLTEEKKDDD